MAALKKLDNDGSSFELCAGVMAHIRRAPLGVILVLGPFNYPLNETYTLAIPGLIMGNTLVMKLPRTGVLCHMPTLAAFQKCFPPGVVNIIAGSGREMMSPIMVRYTLFFLCVLFVCMYVHMYVCIFVCTNDCVRLYGCLCCFVCVVYLL